MKKVEMSNTQLFFLIIGFLLGTTSVLNPAAAVQQDSWLAFILGWIGGLLLLLIYVYISILNPGKTLVEILLETFGKFFGTAISIIYIWYFIHLAAAVLRFFGEYMVTVLYPETPVVFIIICLMLGVCYAVRNGLEVTVRTNELLIPILILIETTLSLSLIGMYNFNHFLPFLEQGLGPILRTALTGTIVPYGENVVLLMVFPFVNKKEELRKTAFIAFVAAGVLFLTILVRDLLTLGPEMLKRASFPSDISAKLIPGIQIDPIVAATMVISGGIKICICTYAAAMAISQLLKLDDYNVFVLPVTAIIVSVSIWSYDSYILGVQWVPQEWTLYSFPFQVIIPVILLVICLFRRNSKSKGHSG